MTVLKLESGSSVKAAEVLQPHIQRLYADPRARFMAVCEFAHSERTQPGPESDKAPSVKVKLVEIEIPVGDQVDLIREAQRALYLTRTAQGTLTEELDLELSSQTLDRLADNLTYADAVRLAAGVKVWLDYVLAALVKPKATVASVRQDMAAVRDGLRSLIEPERPKVVKP